MICATSNFPPCVKHKDDTGYLRRARIWQTSQTFATRPSTLTEQKADPTIKLRITAGAFNAQLLWLVKGLARTLSPELNPSTELEPRPGFMRAIEEECSEGNAKERFKEFVANCVLPCERKQASPMTDFKKAAADFLCITRMQVGVVMTASGYAHQGASVNGTRVAFGFHPKRGEAKGDGLKLK
jgi:hypothetical protein